MKRLLWLVVGLSLFSLIFIPVFAQEPSLSIPETIDLGEVKQTQVVEYFLTLENVGRDDLKIQSITSDCPCTFFQYLVDGLYQPLKPDTMVHLSPGDKRVLKLIFDSNKTKYVGAFKKFVIIHSNDLKQPIARVKLSGKIVE